MATSTAIHFTRVLAVAFTLLAAGGTYAQRLPDAAVDSETESRPLGPPTGSARNDSPGAPITDPSGWVRSGVALAGVIALILGLRFVLLRASKRSGGLAFGTGVRAPSGVLEVLGRYPVARGQTLLLLRMDQRVLLLAQSSAGLTTLAQVTDSDEVASLLVKTRDEEGASSASRFNELLRQMESDPSIVNDERHEPSPSGNPLRARLATFREVRA